MGKRLFVGGVPFDTTEDQLKELFAQAGTIVSVNVVKDKFTGRGRGFAFVEMTTDEEAEKAIQTLNNTELGGRKIVVNEARPLEERKPRSFGGGGRSGGYNRSDRRQSYDR